MSKPRAAQFQTETPFLPQPVAGDVLEALTRPCRSVAEAEAQQARLSALRAQVSAARDTVELALRQNHADYLGGRRSWSYDTRIEVDARLRILKRQSQHLQEAYGQCNRQLKRLQAEAPTGQPGSPQADVARALAFVEAAQQLLEADTLALIWELADTQQPAQRNGVAPGTTP